MDRIPGGLIQLEHLSAGIDTGVVYQDVDRDPLRIERGKHRLDLGKLPDVGADRERALTKLAEALRVTPLIGVVDDDAGAMGGERLRDGPADPLVAAGDEGRLSCQIDHLHLRISFASYVDSHRLPCNCALMGAARIS